MKNPLTKISNDLLEQERPYPGHYRDQNGIPLHGIYVRQYQKTEDKLIISNGNLMRKYKYPRINQTFHSPMLNDYNLHLCGGWRWWGVNDIECITRVFNGKKPMGFWGTDDEESYNYWLHGGDDSKLLKFPNANFLYENSGYKYVIGVCAPGTFDDHFDLKVLAHDYCEYAKAVKDSTSSSQIDALFYGELKGKKIDTYLTVNHTHNITIGDTIITGLILGYPVETTASILWMQ